MSALSLHIQYMCIRPSANNMSKYFLCLWIQSTCVLPYLDPQFPVLIDLISITVWPVRCTDRETKHHSQLHTYSANSQLATRDCCYTVEPVMLISSSSRGQSARRCQGELYACTESWKLRSVMTSTLAVHVYSARLHAKPNADTPGWNLSCCG